MNLIKYATNQALEALTQSELRPNEWQRFKEWLQKEPSYAAASENEKACMWKAWQARARFEGEI